MPNLDNETVAGFGREWARFDQTRLSEPELRALFDRYFRVFPWHLVPPGGEGFDAGCGSGRWARLVAERGYALHLVDASADALDVARRHLAGAPRCEFHLASVSALPLPDGSMDFGYSLGVLHHVPDTARALRACAIKLKAGAPFLLYLYYAFDQRPAWFRVLWRISDAGRRAVSRLPYAVRHAVCDAIAMTVYWPLARLARLAERMGREVGGWPLSTYRHLSFYTMRTDALDRFGTRLERRFTRPEIVALMTEAGFTDIRFSDQEPFWCAVGIRR
jgi:SAM-dependent methyltransferase